MDIGSRGDISPRARAAIEREGEAMAVGGTGAARPCGARRRFWRGAFAAAALAATALSLTPIGAAARDAAARTFDRRDYEFDVVWSVFPEMVLATGDLSLERGGRGYSVGLEARAKLTVPPVDWRGLFAVEGDDLGRDLRPARFERRSIRPSVEETVIVDWAGAEAAGGAPATQVSRVPATVFEPRDPVDAAEITDVIDPLSFMVRMLREVEATNGESCVLDLKTWDGARLARLRTETYARVPAARIDCRVVYEKIDGLRRDTPWRAQEETTLRLVRFVSRGGVWRPERLTIEGDFAGFRSTFTTRIRQKSS